MKRDLFSIFLASSIFVATAAATPAIAVTHEAPAPAAKAQLQDGMRKLWEDHIEYTRNYIISALAGLPDAQQCAERLLRNQDDIGNAVKPFYGEVAGNKLSGLLREHILIAADIVKAARAGDNPGVQAGEQRWHRNADEIAAFLAGANPNLSRTALTDMLYKHLGFTTTEVTSRLAQNWAADIQAYDRGHQHMLMFADMLTDAIARQFPSRFTPGVARRPM